MKKKILDLRAKELGAKLENKKEKGDIQVLTWNGKSIGRYTGPGLLGPTLDKFRSNQFELEQINRLLEKAVSAEPKFIQRTFKLVSMRGN